MSRVTRYMDFLLIILFSLSCTPNMAAKTQIPQLTILTTSLPPATQGAAYSTTLRAAGGVPPYRWSITQGSLPSGLSLNASSGVISGVPTGHPSNTFTVQVADAASAKMTRQLSITVYAPVTLTTATLPAGTQNVVYTATLSASGGVSPYTWSITTGTLPSGLSLNTGSGAISGTPTSPGTSNFTVQVADVNLGAASKALSITIYAPLTIVTTSLPSGTQNTSYSATLSASGGSGSYSWSLVAGSLPDGLFLNASSGVISGTPTAVGTSSFTVRVTDAISNTASQALAITVIAVAQPTISSLSPTAGAVNTGVLVSGNNFGDPQGTSTITFNGTPATPTSWSSNAIVAAVPVGATTGPVIVNVDGVASNSLIFSVTGSTITSLNPSAGGIGTSVTISGSGFGSSQGSSSVTFNGVVATPTSWTGQTVIVPVPAGATSGPIVININGMPITGPNFTVGPGIVSATPTMGGPGTSVTINGSAFGTSQGNSTVTFNGVAAMASSWSDSSIAVPVPAAATTGPLTVAVGGNASNGIVFSVAPSITGATPSGGPVGTPIILNGLNFGLTQGTSTISFNGVAGVATSWGPRSITVPVPAGASTGPLVVTVGGQSSNALNFAVGVGTIAGTVSRTSDQGPISGATVQALRSNNVIASTTSGSDGSYSLASLNPGTYDVRVSASGYGTGLSTGNAVAANQTTQLNVALSTHGTIAGQITQHDGQTPISGATVTVFQGGIAAGQVNSDSGGTYSIPSLASGSYSVQASANGYGTQTQTGIEVTSGSTTPANFSLNSQSNITYEYDDAGRLIGVTDSLNGSAKYAYDAVGNILSISRMAPGQVSIIGFSPSSGPVGTSVIISGTGFSADVAQDAVTINGVAAAVTSASPTQITASVPPNASTGLVAVTAPGGSDTSTTPFVVTAASGTLTITGFDPQVGSPGTAVTVTGTGFDPIPSNNRLKFASSFAAITASTDTSLSTTVPAQAQSGQLSLTTPAGSAVSNAAFYVIPNGMTCLSLDFTTTVLLNGQFGGTIAPTDCALVTFSANAGQQIDFNTTFTADGNEIYLIGPDGTQLAQDYLTGGKDDIAQALPLSGTYGAIIVNQNQSPFSISGTLYDNSDKVYIIDSQNNQITITTHFGQTALVQFTGSGNSHITLHATNITYAPGWNGNLLPASFVNSLGGPFTDLPSHDQTEQDYDLVFPESDTYTMTIGPTFPEGSATLQLMPDGKFTNCGSYHYLIVITTAPYQFCELSFDFPSDWILGGIWINANPVQDSPFYQGCVATVVAADGSPVLSTNPQPCPFQQPGYADELVWMDPSYPGTYTIIFGDAAGARFGGTAYLTTYRN